MSSLIDRVHDRRPFAGEGGRTGAKFESGVLDDGTPVVIKHITPDNWMLVVAGGVSYLSRLWDAGTFDRIPDRIDHAMLAVEPTEAGAAVVMRDVSADVLAEGQTLTREMNRRVLEAMDSMYREFAGIADLGCSVAEHFQVFSPRTLGKLGHLDTPIPGLMSRGWEMFSDVAPPDVASVMLQLLDDPRPLVEALASRPVTLIHGDLRLHNMGLTADRIVLLDWELVGSAPPALEFCWYLIISASRIEASREQIIEDFREVSGERFDPVGLELGVISALAFLGWNKAIDIIENPDPAVRAAERADLDWWIARVRQALEAWSPV